MNFLNRLFLAALFCVLAAFTGFHHGWGNYDQTKVLDYTGTIQESTYENPHASAKIKDDKDKVWTVILAPTSRMQSRGVTAGMIKKGATIQVVGYPHKEVKDEMRAERIIIKGEKYELR
jgi:hypothetical protein